MGKTGRSASEPERAPLTEAAAYRQVGHGCWVLPLRAAGAGVGVGAITVVATDLGLFTPTGGAVVAGVEDDTHMGNGHGPKGCRAATAGAGAGAGGVTGATMGTVA